MIPGQVFRHPAVVYLLEGAKVKVYESIEQLDARLCQPMNLAFGTEVYTTYLSGIYVKVSCKILHCNQSTNFTFKKRKNGPAHIKLNKINTPNHSAIAHRKGIIKPFLDPKKVREPPLVQNLHTFVPQPPMPVFKSEIIVRPSLPISSLNMAMVSSPTFGNEVAADREMPEETDEFFRDDAAVEIMKHLRPLVYNSVQEMNSTAVRLMNDAFSKQRGETPYEVCDDRVNKYVRIRCTGKGCQVRVEFNRVLNETPFGKSTQLKHFRSHGMVHN